VYTATEVTAPYPEGPVEPEESPEPEEPVDPEKSNKSEDAPDEWIPPAI
jgi:hypothetical protein